jgi:hypothetical protein
MRRVDGGGEGGVHRRSWENIMPVAPTKKSAPIDSAALTELAREKARPR